MLENFTLSIRRSQKNDYLFSEKQEHNNRSRSGKETRPIIRYSNIIEDKRKKKERRKKNR